MSFQGFDTKKTVRDINVKGKRVLVRVDFNVPLTSDLKIADDTRIQASVPTVRYLRDRGAKVILISHLGRPKGEIDPKYSLKICAKRFSQILGEEILFCPETVGDVAKAFTQVMAPGDIVVLENVRFYPGEEKNDPEFAAKLAELGDIYVNDAFGACHRYHASMEGIAHLLPAVAGLLVEKELVIMGKALSNPDRPFIGIMGGIKVSDKIGVIQNLLTMVDNLLIGGAMGNTFMAAKGYDLGKSLVNTSNVEWAKELLSTENGKKLVLPVDYVVADSFDENAKTKVVAADKVLAGWMALDIGPETIKIFGKKIKDARTVFWNGPMGVFEMAPFSNGTREMALMVATTGGTSIIGGGDTIAALESEGLSHRVNHISTGGGSTLEFLEGIELPAIKALDSKDKSEMEEI